MRKQLFCLAAVSIYLGLAACSKHDNITPPPTITDFNPTHGYIGDTIIITGTGFLSSDSVYFAGTAVTKVINVTPTQFKVVVPAGAGSGNIRVRYIDSAIESKSSFTVDHFVYVCGDEYVYGSACYWVDNSQVVFVDATGSPTSSIYVAGKDVYVAGNRANIATYWKNGTPISLGCNLSYAQANAVLVSDGDVYVAGYEAVYNNVATYWKNGKAVHLTDGANSSSYANSIYVSGNDVYVAGLEGDGRCVYWKNGTEVVLPGCLGYPGATSIFVSGDDVYVAGNDSYTAKYWKNGVLVNLTSRDSCTATTTAISVSGNDVYVAGSEHSNFDAQMRATYWKNGKTVYLNEPSEYAMANAICVSGSDVYVAGMVDYYSPVYWINGTGIPLKDGGHANGLFIK